MKTVFTTLAAFVGYTTANEFCWKDIYTRGNGVPIHACPPKYERDGALCYPQCDAGYYGKGPTCWGKCEGGMNDTGVSCEKKSYGRGGGRAITTCSQGQEKNGALCYPNCKDGYSGNGPVCWQTCPKDYRDDGATCARDAHIYGKGCCCFFGNCCGGVCPLDYHDDPCTCRRDVHIFGKASYGRGAGVPLGCGADEELNGGLCYPKPKAGYSGAGPVAWQNCLGQTVDSGTVCTKKSYGRTAGVPLTCDQTNEYLENLFCYKNCKPGYTLVKGWCVAGCPKGWVDCGNGCAVNQAQCNNKVKSKLEGDLQQVAADAAFATTGAGEAKHAANIEKVTKLSETTPELMARLKVYATLIKNIAADQLYSDTEAMSLAKKATAAIMTGMEYRGRKIDDWTVWMTYIEKIDPTGYLGAAQSFLEKPCASITAA